ncbi:PQQ-dependent sugar dehydrogenase [Rhodocytophaga aerolata]|uniref:PQQ-dependent sugar dehydrogenase n=1 Tax=Rhodocytophaga aerolata TaxID=455078 RepID=A0ABT8RGQ5_9BACT|nr:PQQ-dependent sugar dehydrogenase [Rhodocytophaga aerolata]MDO1450881.1 PQQ-dependent sugar dehydrogenase [Rhodocytophaga aerolata]
MKNVHKLFIGTGVLLAIAIGCNKDDIFNELIPETNEQPTTSQVQGYVFKPALAEPTAENVAQLKVPAGFAVNKFAEGLGKPRILAVGSMGQVYVTDREAGTVTMLMDTNGDGIAENSSIVANIKQVHGITLYNNMAYMVAVREVYRAAMNPDGTLGQPQLLINDLPDAGQHPNRTIAFGPDGFMYITVGSTCNSCPEPNPENATILRANADGTNRKIFAKGLRNTIGFGWHPQTSELWGMDHGIDWLGDNEQKEELNKITQNADYGWPYIFGEGKYNPSDRPKGDTTYAQYLAKTTLPSLTYQAHSAPMGMVFYTGSQFPADYQNNAFVAMRGSWNRSAPVGYNVVRVRFENGQPAAFEDFLSGFLVNNNKAHFARLVGLAVHTDGSLLVSDDTNGVIYRVAYTTP